MSSNTAFTGVFPEKPILGVIHLPALPTAPRNSKTLDEIIEFALEEHAKLESAGIDGVTIENIGDFPFFRVGCPPATVAAMAVVVREVARHARVAVGVNLLRNAWEEGLAIAHIAGAQYIRVNVVIGAVVTDQGIIQGCAAELARVRKSLDRDVLVFADVHVKHASTLFDVPLVDAARDLADRGGVDAVIITGPRSPVPPSFEEVSSVAEAIDLPVVVGSGISFSDAPKYYEVSGGIMIGEVDFKVNREYNGATDEERYASAIKACRSGRAVGVS